MYRASRDGFSGKDFHSRCDRMEKTLTVIKSESGNVFGGYTDKAGTSDNKYETDSSAFLFSLINKENRPFRVVCSDGGKHAIAGHPNYGPRFGCFPQDLHIAGNSNTNESSYCNFGHTYKHPDYPVGTEETKNILAGSYYFKTTEIEVYAKVN